MKTAEMTHEIQAGSNLPEKIDEQPKLEGGAAKASPTPAVLGTGSFTTFWTWRGNGVAKNLNFTHPAINANSRVFVSISEFNSDARINRFIGDARMAVYNVAPYNGGFHAWVEVSWSNPLNARFDVLVDP